MSAKTFYFHNLETKEAHKLRDEMIIGRNETADIFISNSKVSGKHLQVFISEDSIYIEDLKTSNGTVIDGIEAKPYSRYELREESKVVLGGAVAFLVSEKKEINLEDMTITGIEKSRFTDLEGVKASGGARVSLSSAIELDIGAGLRDDDMFGEREVNRALKQYNTKLEKILDEIEKIDKKIIHRDKLAKDLAEIEEVFEQVEQEAEPYKNDYMENIDTWEKLETKIKILERDLNRLKNKREQLIPKMEKYSEYLDFKKKKQDMGLEYKTLKREALEDKKDEYEIRVQEVKKTIQSSKHQLHQIAIKKDELKQKEKQKIQAQIKELQQKLKDAG